MSNLGVILLSKKKPRDHHRIKRFEIEDNIGEAIHIHMDNLRIDLSIEEFLRLADAMSDALNKIELIPGFNLSTFDPTFLLECCDHLQFLEKVELQEINLNKLSCITYTNRQKSLYRVEKIRQTPIFKFLDLIEQHGKNNKNRILGSLSHDEKKHSMDIYDSIVNSGYPFKSYIILFGNQDIIRDGQHRASSLMAIDKDESIPILRFYFKSGYKKHILPENFLVVIFNYLKSNLKRCLLGLFYKVKILARAAIN